MSDEDDEDQCYCRFSKDFRIFDLVIENCIICCTDIIFTKIFADVMELLLMKFKYVHSSKNICIQ